MEKTMDANQEPSVEAENSVDAEQAEFEAAFAETLENGAASSEHSEVSEPEPTSEAEEAEPTGEPEVTGTAGEPEPAGETGEPSEPEDPGLPLSAFDEQTIKALLAKSAKVDELEAAMTRQAQELRRAYGKIGELNSHIKQLMKAPTQRGIKQAELRFARLEEEYPELAELLREDLAQALDVAQETVDSKGDQQANVEAETAAESSEASEASQGVSPDQLAEQLAAQRELETRIEYEKKLLTLKHPDWEVVAMSPDFNIWLASQPTEIQQIARSSWSAEELAPIFDLYKETKSVMAQRTSQVTEARKKRLETAVPVTTNGSASPPVSDEVDEFVAGFQSVMGQRLG